MLQIMGFLLYKYYLNLVDLVDKPQDVKFEFKLKDVLRMGGNFTLGGSGSAKSNKKKSTTKSKPKSKPKSEKKKHKRSV